MQTTPVTNFAVGTVTAPGYNASDTSIVLVTGHGSRFPSTFPYPLIWWNATDFASPADDPNREIVLVVGRSGDTLTVTRGQEGISATTKNTANKTYRMFLGITKNMWDGLQSRAFTQSFRGVFLQSHPDSDKRLSQVRLISAEAIVMNDGEEVRDWLGHVTVPFNFATANGVGGLDTGSEQPSTWYKIFALWNGVNGAGVRALMAQRAKTLALGTEYTTGEDASQGLRSAVDNSTVRIGQLFQSSVAGKLVMADVKLVRTGSPTGNLWFTIETNNAGVPSNTIQATSDLIDVSRIPTTATVVRIGFRVPPTILADFNLHVVAHGDYAVSASNFISWRMDGSAASYSLGHKSLYDSDTGTWTQDTDDDMYFRIYVATNDAALVVPGGYRYAHIGWAYNDGSSNLRQFVQADRHWQLANLGEGQIVNELTAAITLVDLRDWLPPLDMIVAEFGLTATGAAAAVAAIGDVKCTDLSNVSPAGAQALLRAGGAAEIPESSQHVTLSFSALMIDSSAGADLYLRSFNF